jgi:microcystin-dependent protein
MATNPGLPVGTIVMWGGKNNTPDGWLVCDGTPYKQAGIYNVLFLVIGKNFGNPEKSPTYDPATDFFVPDLQGQFIRGVDASADGHGDPERSSRVDMKSGAVVGNQVGSVQADEVGPHTHGYDKLGIPGKIASGETWAHELNNTAQNVGIETRPKNAYLYFIIKAF